MKRKGLLVEVLCLMVCVFTTVVYAQEKKFIQPCPDAGGYRTWLKEPDGTYIDHLGHDYKAPTGTEVKAIADGIIHYVNPSAFGFGGDKPSKPGPMMWVKHRLENGKYFYALYGHVESTKKEGEKVKAGEVIGTIFPFKIGENLHPHLHFGIWNSENDPPIKQLGYGPVREFVDPIKFLKENKPYSERKIDEKEIGEKATLKGKIVFLDTDDEKGERKGCAIWTSNIDGTNRRRITHFSLIPEISPYWKKLPPEAYEEKIPIIAFGRPLRWSPDGKKIAFLGARFKEAAVESHHHRNVIGSIGAKIFGKEVKKGGIDIWIINEDGTGLEPLTHFANVYLSERGFHWSPDGKKIAYIHQETYGAEIIGKDYRLPDGTIYTVKKSPSEIRVVDVGTKETKVLLSNVFFTYEIIHYPLPPFPIEAIKDNQIREKLTTIKKIQERGIIGCYTEICWSPDGKKIVLSDLSRKAEWDFGDKIFVMNADGSDFHSIANTFGTPCGDRKWLGWPDGGRKLFWWPNGKITFIHEGKSWVMDSDGNNLKVITDGYNIIEKVDKFSGKKIFNPMFPFWVSRDNKTILFYKNAFVVGVKNINGVNFLPLSRDNKIGRTLLSSGIKILRGDIYFEGTSN